MVDIYLYNRDQLPVPRWVPLFHVGICVISAQIFLEDPLRPFGWLRCGSDWDQQPSPQGQHREEPLEGSGRRSTTSYIQCRSKKQICWAMSAADGSDKSKIGCWEILSLLFTVAPTPGGLRGDGGVSPPGLPPPHHGPQWPRRYQEGIHVGLQVVGTLLDHLTFSAPNL